MKKLPAWTHRYVMPFVLSIIMTAIVSGISTIRVGGFDSLMDHWLSAWVWSWIVAFPTLLCMMPIANWIISWIVEDPRKN